MSERNLEPIEWQRGDGLALYQPKVTYSNGLSSALFERIEVWGDPCMTKYWADHNYDGHPVVYRSRKRAIRVARRHLKKINRERMHRIHRKEGKDNESDDPEVFIDPYDGRTVPCVMCAAAPQLAVTGVCSVECEEALEEWIKEENNE